MIASVTVEVHILTAVPSLFFGTENPIFCFKYPQFPGFHSSNFDYLVFCKYTITCPCRQYSEMIEGVLIKGKILI